MENTKPLFKYHHYAYRTEGAYCQWILRDIHFYGGKTHPKELGPKHVEQFLSHLAHKGKVSASTQRQALNALVFLYRHVLHIPLEGEIAPIRTLQELLGHGNVKTTEIYTHVMQRDIDKLLSQLDRISPRRN